MRAIGLFYYALRYPICTLPVLEALLRVPGNPEKAFDVQTAERSEAGTLPQLPRRLFKSLTPKTASESSQTTNVVARPSSSRNILTGPPRGFQFAASDWSNTDDPLPILRVLHTNPRISSPRGQDYDGYPLNNAVQAGFRQLVRFMLTQGANPALQEGISVLIAVSRKDLACARMLIERTEDGDEVEEGSKPVSRPGSHKRRKLEDRVPVTAQMLRTAIKHDARDIVDYLMKEKECVPDIPTLALMST